MFLFMFQLVAQANTILQSKVLELEELDEVKHQGPDGVHQQKNNAESVGNTVALSERISEPTRCSNVFLQ